MKGLRLGTRGSQLALRQAHLVADCIKRIGGPACELVIIRTSGDIGTSGDRPEDLPLSESGGKRLFVKEIEEALSSGAVDAAVHSAKDLPVLLAEGLSLAACLPRNDPSDALILPAERSFTGSILDDFVRLVGPSPRIGTSSVRRTAQLARLWPQPRFVPIRGNLDTRLRKLDRGEYDLLVLAVAGLLRLGLADRLSCVLPLATCVPAPGQGAIAVEARTEDEEILAALTSISDDMTMRAVEAERALVEALGGDCRTPIGAVAIPCGREMELHAVVASLDGQRSVQGREQGLVEAPKRLGANLARRLIADGALEILDEVKKHDA